MADKPVDFYSRRIGGVGTNYLLSPNCISAYKFDSESAYPVVDVVDSNNLTGSGVETFLPGKFNNAIYLKQTNPYDNAGMSSAANLVQSKFTFVGWIKAGYFVSPWNFLGADVNESNNDVVFWLRGNSSIGFHFRDSTSVYSDSYDVSFGANLDSDWHHFALYIDNTSGGIFTAKGYYDGNLVMNTSGNSLNRPINKPMYYGWIYSVAFPPYPEIYFDDVAWFNRELSQSEIQEIMNNSLDGSSGSSDYPLNFYSRRTPSTLLKDDPDCLIYYPFDEAAGLGSVFDYVGSNDAVITTNGNTFKQGITVTNGPAGTGAGFDYRAAGGFLITSDFVTISSKEFTVASWVRWPSTFDNPCLFTNMTGSGGGIQLQRNGDYSGQGFTFTWLLGSAYVYYAKVRFTVNYDSWNLVAFILNWSSSPWVQCYSNNTLLSWYSETTYASISANSALQHKYKILSTTGRVSTIWFYASQFAVFNRGLSTADLATLYTSGMGGAGEESDMSINFYSVTG